MDWEYEDEMPPLPERNEYFDLTLKQHQRLWSRIGRPDEYGCQRWTGRLDKDGYGLFDIGHTPIRVVRYVLYLFTQQVGQEACHDCQDYGAPADVPSCCNPMHLYWGTRSDNMKDRANRGRQAGGRASYTRKMEEMFDGYGDQDD